MAKLFCLDIGNTHADYGLLDGTEIIWADRVATSQFTDPDLELPRTLKTLGVDDAVAGIAYASVVPAATHRLERLLTSETRPVLALSGRNCPALPIVYPKPQQIGADMLAGATAARHLFGTPVLVVSLGTAVAMSVITADGYEGGVIAPGLNMMADALHDRTALLPKLDFASLDAATGPFGRSTEEAMAIGCRTGFIGLVRGLVEHLSTALVMRGLPAPRLAVTGGSARLLPADWHPRAVYDPQLNLKGLAVAFARWHESA